MNISKLCDMIEERKGELFTLLSTLVKINSESYSVRRDSSLVIVKNTEVAHIRAEEEKPAALAKGGGGGEVPHVLFSVGVYKHRLTVDPLVGKGIAVYVTADDRIGGVGVARGGRKHDRAGRAAKLWVDHLTDKRLGISCVT